MSWNDFRIFVPITLEFGWTSIRRIQGGRLDKRSLSGYDTYALTLLLVLKHTPLVFRNEHSKKQKMFLAFVDELVSVWIFCVCVCVRSKDVREEWTGRTWLRLTLPLDTFETPVWYDRSCSYAWAPSNACSYEASVCTVSVPTNFLMMMMTWLQNMYTVNEKSSLSLFDAANR